MTDVVSVVLAIKSVWEAIKGTRELKKVDLPLAMNGEARKDFLNNNPNSTIINIAGNCYIGDKSQITQEEKDKLKEIYNPTTQSEKNYDIIDTDFFGRIQEFKKELPDNKSINPFLKFLEHDLRTILNLSIYSKKLFDNKEGEKAQKVRDDIGKQYGKGGRKLCNLYLSGYIDGMTEFLIQEYGDNLEKVKSDINNKIRKFVEDSDYIFFVHSSSDENHILNNILECINQGRPYIAIHGAGPTNIKKVRNIISKIEGELSSFGYDKNEDNKRTLSLCPLLYVYLTKKKI
ncbi:MAG: hypothetical protein KJ600_04275 [Nanoarchaeota archaeon]|nr:hypothetical protein [Nanoarchaeota archaeon]MBU1103744.1 hypothetical protein [Nanoarchaeota archaeon]